VKPQGRHGEVAAEIHTDFPERFAERECVFALDARGGRRELRLENFWLHKGRVILKFAGVASISDAEALAGAEIQIPEAERTQLQPGAAYVSDLVGCEVALTGSRRVLGKIADVQFGAGEAPLLVIRDERGTELLIPYVESFIVEANTKTKRVELNLPEGMLEVDGPLSDEEKQRQHRRE